MLATRSEYMQIQIGLQIILQILDLTNGKNGSLSIMCNVNIKGNIRCGNVLHKEKLMELKGM